ncbi:MAG: twin-arginine translocase subunit TatC [Gemmataceae bacterium]|jgi:sec-independent protein translocase protein TatC|nr:twin-arginine translocase subunit TatC [Gemmataceae bacterium]
MKLFESKPAIEYGDDYFESTRMSFGDHLEELRTRMWKAIYGVGLILFGGMLLDMTSQATGIRWIGFGRLALDFITEPVKESVKKFYEERNDKAINELEKSRKDQSSIVAKSQPMRVQISRDFFTSHFEGIQPKPDTPEMLELELQVYPAELSNLSDMGTNIQEKRSYITALSAMEGMVVYIKVLLLCSAVIASPWLFWQFWAFVGAGLYPHEKRLVHVYLPFSVGLFLFGVILCQFAVMPTTLQALLAFNKFLNIDPDLRLKEWLGFAIMMPLVFGIAFQTPLVMLFFNRIGVFSWQDYLSKWRYAMFILAVLSALLTPSPDVVSMLWLFIPTFGLYLGGVLLCKVLPPPQSLFGPIWEEDVGV